MCAVTLRTLSKLWSLGSFINLHLVCAQARFEIACVCVAGYRRPPQGSFQWFGSFCNSWCWLFHWREYTGPCCWVSRCQTCGRSVMWVYLLDLALTSWIVLAKHVGNMQYPLHSAHLFSRSQFSSIDIFSRDCEVNLGERLAGAGLVTLLSGSGSIHAEEESGLRQTRKWEVNKLGACKWWKHWVTCCLFWHSLSCLCGEYQLGKWKLKDACRCLGFVSYC